MLRLKNIKKVDNEIKADFYIEDSSECGHIVIDIRGEQRANMSVYDLIERFHANTGSNLADDRILLAK